MCGCVGMETRTALWCVYWIFHPCPLSSTVREAWHYPLPPPITSEEWLWMGVLRWGRCVCVWGGVDSLMVSASTCMHMQTLCSPTSVQARPVSAETFGWSSISVWNYCKIIFMLPSSLAYDWKLYSCLYERKRCCKLCYSISAGAICIPNHHPGINKWICYFEFMFHSSHCPLVDITQLRRETRVEQM